MAPPDEGKAWTAGEAVEAPVKMTDATFDDMVKNHHVVVIDCWAPWCSPCRAIAPVIEDLAREYKGKVLFAKLNTDENTKVPTQFKIMAIPTLLIFKGGELVDRIVGVTPKKGLVEKLHPYVT